MKLLLLTENKSGMIYCTEITGIRLIPENTDEKGFLEKSCKTNLLHPKNPGEPNNDGSVDYIFTDYREV